jgi:hypothetical protein
MLIHSWVCDPRLLVHGYVIIGQDASKLFLDPSSGFRPTPTGLAGIVNGLESRLPKPCQNQDVMGRT